MPADADEVSEGCDAVPPAGPCPDGATFLQLSVSAFVDKYNLDKRASCCLKKLTPIAQLDVIVQTMQNVRNPSAVVAVRCAKAASSGAAIGTRAAKWLRQACDSVCSHYGIPRNSPCHVQLMQLAPELQYEAIAAPIAELGDPAAVLQSRIHQVRRQAAPPLVQEAPAGEEDRAASDSDGDHEAPHDGDWNAGMPSGFHPEADFRQPAKVDLGYLSTDEVLCKLEVDSSPGMTIAVLAELAWRFSQGSEVGVATPESFCQSVIQAVVWALETYVDDAALQLVVLKSTLAFLRHVPRAKLFKEMFLKRNGLARFLATMERFWNHERIQHVGCGLTTILGAGQAKPFVLSSGGLAAVVNAMRYHPRSAVVQETGCGTLWSFAIVSSRSEPLTQYVVQTGALSIILEAMWRFSGSEYVQRAACGALSSMVRTDTTGAVVAGLQGPHVVDLIMQPLQNFPGSKEVQKESCELILYLVGAQQDPSRQALTYALWAVRLCASQPSEHARRIHIGCKTLARLASQKPVAHKLLDLNVVPLLCELAEAFGKKKNIQVYVCQTFNRLLNNIDSGTPRRPDMFDGVVRAIHSAIVSHRQSRTIQKETAGVVEALLALDKSVDDQVLAPMTTADAPSPTSRVAAPPGLPPGLASPHLTPREDNPPWGRDQAAAEPTAVPESGPQAGGALSGPMDNSVAGGGGYGKGAAGGNARSRKY